MTNLELGVVVFAAMMLLIALRMPIAIALFLGGSVGFAMLAGIMPLLGLLNEAPYSRVATHSLTVIPLFILMGQFAALGGISQALYRSARAWVGHYRGGIAIATIGGCAAFGAICGSSVATGATMATIAMPEMRRYGYSGALATGSLAAGGTLGILIPPSLILVIYAILTESSLAHLFVAAIIPGLIAVVGYATAIGIYVRVNPLAGPAAGPSISISKSSAGLALWGTVSPGDILARLTVTTASVGSSSMSASTMPRGSRSCRSWPISAKRVRSPSLRSRLLILQSLVSGSNA